MAASTPAPIVTDAPASTRGRKRRAIDADVLPGYTEAFNGLTPGQIVQWHDAFDTLGDARSHVVVLKRDIAEALNIAENIVKGRAWEVEGGKFACGVTRKSED